MSYLTAIVMGLIQGVAEFLPISSSGHLAIFQNFFCLGNIRQVLGEGGGAADSLSSGSGGQDRRIFDAIGVFPEGASMAF